MLVGVGINQFEQFREELREALMHLRDPDYSPPPLLCAVLSRSTGGAPGLVQAAILEGIKSLRPSDDVPSDARARRDFDVLYYRFVVGMTQERVAERLHMSERSMRRAQREATHTLACWLWERRLVQELPSLSGEAEDVGSADLELAAWRVQARQDLAALQTGRSGSISDVAESITYSIRLVQDLLARYGVHLELARVEPNLMVPLHPSVLRQVMVGTFAQVARCVTYGPITVMAVAADDYVHIEVKGPTSGQDHAPDISQVREILALQGGSVEATVMDGCVRVQLRLPVVGKVNVLIVDDNADLVYFYRRCMSGTRYHVLQAEEGQRNVEAIAALEPDVIVLDILLPDVDGWELLRQLRQHPKTKTVPIIVCSILGEEELASALGATLYLPKPVDREQLIQAFDQALSRAQVEPSKISTNSTIA